MTNPQEYNLSGAAQAYAYFASRYGIGYDDLEIKWLINDDGSAFLQRVITVEAFSIVESLDTYLSIPESNEDRKIEFISVDSLSKDWNVALSDVKKEPGRGSAIISISPPLNKTEKMRYSMVEELSSGLYAINLTTDEIFQRESKYDYGGWNINRPTRKVSLQIEFPKLNTPEVFSSEVRYASTSGFPSSRVHQQESERFNPIFTPIPKGDKNILRLDVDYPMLGLIYILRWQPVAKVSKKTTNQKSTDLDSQQAFHRKILEILIERFDEEELRTLSFALGVGYDNLPANGTDKKARELIKFLGRRKQIRELVKIGGQQRPDILWPEPPDFM